MSKCPLIIDFEATSLHNDGSYPIEMAWTKSNGEIVSHLIDIGPVMDKVYWDFNSECIHNISMDEVLSKGINAQEVVEQFLADVDGRQILISDGPAADMQWLRVLFAQTTEVSPFSQIHDFKDYLSTVVRNKTSGTVIVRDVVDDLIENGVEVHRTHRAFEDVQTLRNTFHRAMVMRPKNDYAPG